MKVCLNVKSIIAKEVLGLSKHSMKLQSGSSRSFEFELDPGMYQYFMALCDSAEFRAFKFEEIGKFKYLVTLNGGVYSEKR